MTTFLAFCAGIATAALVVGVVSLVRALEEIRLTAQQARKTAAAVEQLATHLDETARNVAGVSGKVHELTDALKFNWIRGLQVAVTFIQGLREKWAAEAQSEPQPTED